MSAVTTQEFWGVRALPAEIAVWFEDRVEPQPEPDASEVAMALERRRARMTRRVRRQTARTLAAYMPSIAAYLVNSILNLERPVLPEQFPSGVGQYVNYPLNPPVPVQLHVVTKLPDARGGVLSANIDELALVQTRLVLDWFAGQHAADRHFYTGTGIVAIRSTLWIANARRVLELDPARGTVIDSEGWGEPGIRAFPSGYRVPPLGKPPAG